MIGIDTNVVVRYLAQDDPEQSPVASALIDELTETDPGYVSLVTIVEIYWVLRRAYKVTAERCCELLAGLLDARELRVDRSAVVRAALTATRGGLDFADSVIAELGSAAGCDHTVTFDQRAARDGSMRILDAKRLAR
ncbi:MAG: PIN domain-containing protein [Acidimicrobiales bacterium]